MVHFYLYSVSIFYVFFISSVASSTCKKTLSLCKLTHGDADSINFPQKGLKGERGDSGLKGQKGECGLPVFSIVPGIQGEKGFKGMPGEAPRGPTGERGGNGIKGITGDAGFPGLTGRKGFQGDKGKMGLSGAMGLPGPPGPNGSCPCAHPKLIKPMEKVKVITMCKDSTFGIENYVKFDFDEFPEEKQVICEPREGLTTLTCIPPKTMVDPKSSLDKYSFTNISKGFWLSSRGATLDSIYGYNREQIEWFLKRSNSAFQTIRYHCYNSVPFSRDDVNKSLLLFTWNEKTIGPVPTVKNPVFYSVPPETDGCSKTINAWSHTDITIVSNTHRRVPVIDFFIRNTGNIVPEHFKIEHVKLCFD